jgi:hypothetical protein
VQGIEAGSSLTLLGDNNQRGQRRHLDDETQDTALALLMADGTRTDLVYATRVPRLRNGKASVMLSDATMHHDTAIDVLTGGSELDRLWGKFGDLN